MFVCTIGTLIGREEKEKTRYVLPPELEKFLLNESDLPGYKLKYESEWMRPGEERRSDIATAKDIKSGIRQRWINLLGGGNSIVLCGSLIHLKMLWKKVNVILVLLQNFIMKVHLGIQ